MNLTRLGIQRMGPDGIAVVVGEPFIVPQAQNSLLDIAVREIAPVRVGDMVVIRTKDRWSEAQKMRTVEMVSGALRLPSTSNVLILDAGASLDIVRGLKPPARGTRDMNEDRKRFDELTAERERTEKALIEATPALIDRLTTMQTVDELVAIVRDAFIVIKPAFLADQAWQAFRDRD